MDEAFYKQRAEGFHLQELIFMGYFDYANFSCEGNCNQTVDSIMNATEADQGKRSI